MATCRFCNERLSLQEIWYPYKHMCPEKWAYYESIGDNNE